MEHLIRIWQALTAIELMFKRVARDVELAPLDTWVLVVAAVAGEPVSGAWLARQTGRARQQVHRSLEALALRKLVARSDVADAQAVRWEVTPLGKRVVRLVDVIAQGWLLGATRRVDLEALGDTLERLVISIVNRDTDGWRRGLSREVSAEGGELQMVAEDLADELVAEFQRAGVSLPSMEERGPDGGSRRA